MSSSARKILIVDDDPWVGKLVEFVARDLGLEPLLAQDGTTALDLFGEHLPDLVVVDVVLPKVDGIQLSRRIKTTGPGAFTPVVVVSGIYRGEPETLAKARADAFFAKPLSPEVLGRRLSALFPPAAEGSANAAMGPPDSGEVAFAAQPFALALAKAHRKKSTGVLHVRSRSVRAELTLLEGSVISVHSDSWSESLADVLLRLQLITSERRARLEVLVSSGAAQDFGDAVVREAILTPEELAKLMASQQMLRVTEMFGWTDGFHRFVEETVSGSAVDLETPSLVHWGLRRMPVPPRALEDALPSLTGPLIRKPGADAVLKILPLSRAEKWLLSRANGKTTFQDLWSQVRDDKAGSDILTRSVLAMNCLGAIDVQIPKMAPVVVQQERLAQVLPALEPAPSRPLFGSPSSVLLTLWREKATGVVVVDLPDESLVFYLKDGQLVTVRPPGGERLESVLVKRGKIRADILPQLRLLQAAGRNVGDALVELQAISLMQLHAFVRGELRVALRELVRKKTVDASFTPSPLSAQEHVRHEWDTGLALIESVRSLELTFVRAELPPKDGLIQRDPSGDSLVEMLPLSPNERNLWNLLGTPQPRERLEGIGIVSEADQARALWVLMAVGIAKQIEAPKIEEEDIVVVDDDDDVPTKETEASLRDVSPEELHSSTAPQPTIREAVKAAQGSEAKEPEPKDAAPPDGASHEAVAKAPEAKGNETKAGEGSRRRRRESLALPDMTPPLPDDRPVSRADYEQLLSEKRELERRLLLMLDQSGGLVSREVFDALLTEKTELKAQLVSLVDEVIRLKSSGAFVPTGHAPTRSLAATGTFDGDSDFSEGSVLTFKRTRH